jgi:hypothetical protein
LSTLLLLFVLALLLFLRALLLLFALVLLLFLSALLLLFVLVLLLFLSTLLLFTLILFWFLLLFGLGFLLLLRRLRLFLLCVRGSNASKKEQNSRTEPSNSLHDSSLHYCYCLRPSSMTSGAVVIPIRAYDLFRVPMTSRTTPPTKASPPSIGGRGMCS